MLGILASNLQAQIFADYFNRADSALTLGASGSGHAYGTPFNDSPGATPPVFGISSGKGYVATEGDDSGMVFTAALLTGNIDFSFDLTWVTGANFGIACRGNGTATRAGARHYMCRISTNLALFSYDGTGYTSLGTYAFSPADGTTYSLRIKAVGSAIEVFLDGTSRIAVTNADHAGTCLGLRTGNNAGTPAAGKRWDNFVAKVA